ncbi:MAG: ribonuclease III [Candidatus Pacebacteria bacterium]|nr:ribonuclease III [Candidatus Paceibacterota bacterium]
MNDFSLLENNIGIVFKNKDLLLQAFCHRSYINENPDFLLGHNERMEFLGDAVLELTVTEYLYKNYPDKTEGDLTSLRAALVNTKILSETSEELGFNDFILLSKGENREVGKSKQSILANTFESLVGAIYLDQGYNSCNEFINNNLITKLPNIIKFGLDKDNKSRLQEEAQRILGVTPTYSVLAEEGPDHRKNFTVGVFLGDNLVARGNGFSKQAGEEDAAGEALKVKGWPCKDCN